MAYRYRFIYLGMGIAIFIFLAYQIDIKYLIKDLKTMRARVDLQQRELITRQQRTKDPEQNAYHKKTNTNVLSASTSIVHEGELEIVNISSLARQGEGKSQALYQFSLRGDYRNILYFLNSFDEMHAGYQIKDYSFTVDNQHKILATIAMTHDGQMQRNSRPTSMLPTTNSNPFCDTNGFLIAANKNQHEFSIHEIRLLGLMRRAGKNAAVFVLPNGLLINVKRGELLGNENAVVTAVNENRVTLLLANRTQQIISR